MTRYTSLVENRNIVLNRVNEELLGEGLSPQTATGKAFISPFGIVWHEILDPEYRVLAYATSHPFNMRNVTVVTEISEALDFDADVK